MDQDNPGTNPDNSAKFPIKRQRGRPKKFSRLNYEENAVRRDQNLNRRENADKPRGFANVNGNHSHQVDSNSDLNDVMVGQVVHGVIEAAFDAGYLLAVKVGNTETTLRGVVFKPGHYVPVSADNDVAPNVHMVRRNQIPFPADNHNHSRGYNSRSRERSEQHVNSSRIGTINTGAPKSSQTSFAAVQTSQPVIPRKNITPVVLQPVNLSNGGRVACQPTSVATQAPCPEVSKGKQVMETVHPSNGSTPSNQVKTAESQPVQAQNYHQVVLNQPSVEVLHEAETKSMKMPDMPFEKLVEVIQQIQSPSQSEKAQTGNVKDETVNTDQALSIEPLQAVQPNPTAQSAFLSKPFDIFTTGKMTELLQAVQDNTMENQVHQAEELTTGSELNLDNLKSPEAEI
ncbi:uncharacterized protein LOC123219889 [Mangifera indica]|uniref:uncharacterized protein LOC123219889 n=1 Tax=Mangifera indica TaxID=29780 RepID=UPI001CFA5203|nr:uncharacterized protein LOC123219889 [Mangifera indica]XP_044497790.1 uncharacterized protein LOC123219889 [Mangifera indica]XP_044497797.1 uncharacterized protein LOC123219889 [Mangifera indica]